MIIELIVIIIGALIGILGMKLWNKYKKVGSDTTREA